MGFSRGLLGVWGSALVLVSCAPQPTEAPLAAPELHADCGPIAATLPSSAAEPMRLESRRPGEPSALTASVSLVGASPRASREEPEGRFYEGALGAGFDWSLRTKPRAVEDTLSLPEMPPAGEVRYRLALGEGVAGLRVAGGVVELVDPDGTPRLRVSRASVIDARGRRTAVALDVEGCAVDRDARPPWRRAVVPPGASSCDVVARLPPDLAYPASFDPLWSAAGDMVVPRYNFQTATLDDGTVLAVGGIGETGNPIEVESFDPSTLTWSLLGTSGWLPTGAQDFELTKLVDGRLLFTGGEWDVNGTHTVKSVLAFSQATSSWSVLPDMANERKGHSATRMSDGRVLVVGGEFDSTALAECEIFDPTSDTWSPAPPLAEGHAYHRALAIDDRVLVASGVGVGISNDNHSVVFDPSGSGSWSAPRLLAQGRWGHALVPLGGGKILMAGGYQNDTFGFATVVELYDVSSDTWSIPMCGSVACSTPPLVEVRATVGPLGGVIMTGGCNEASPYCGNAASQALWFDPTDGTPHPAGTSGPARGKHGMVALADGRIVVMGGQGGIAGVAVLDDTHVFAVEPPGLACALGFECATGTCADGVCCDVACDAVCEACTFALTGQPDGTCAPVLDGTDPEDECVDSGALTCQGSGLCQDRACGAYAAPGCDAGACDADADCASFHCVDGVCCDTACVGNCVACTAAKKGEGPDGVCGFVAVGTDPDDDCDDAGASNCNQQGFCDGLGVCHTGADACSPGVCIPGGCRSVCEVDADCADDGACVAKLCVARDALCTNESQALLRDGSTVDCAPFRCTADGACLTECGSVGDCANGSVCDDTDGTCVPAPAESGGDAGCACSAAGASAPGRGVVGLAALALGLGVAASRRRRAR